MLELEKTVEFTLKQVKPNNPNAITITLTLKPGHEIKVVGAGFVEAYLVGINEFIWWEGAKYHVFKKYIKDWSYC